MSSRSQRSHLIPRKPVSITSSQPPERAGSIALSIPSSILPSDSVSNVGVGTRVRTRTPATPAPSYNVSTILPTSSRHPMSNAGAGTPVPSYCPPGTPAPSPYAYAYTPSQALMPPGPPVSQLAAPMPGAFPTNALGQPLYQYPPPSQAAQTALSDYPPSQALAPTPPPSIPATKPAGSMPAFVAHSNGNAPGMETAMKKERARQMLMSMPVAQWMALVEDCEKAEHEEIMAEMRKNDEAREAARFRNKFKRFLKGE